VLASRGKNRKIKIIDVVKCSVWVDWRFMGAIGYNAKCGNL